MRKKVTKKTVKQSDVFLDWVLALDLCPKTLDQTK